MVTQLIAHLADAACKLEQARECIDIEGDQFVWDRLLELQHELESIIKMEAAK